MKKKKSKPENLSLGTDDEKFLQQLGVKVEKQDTLAAAIVRAMSKSKRGFVNPRTGEITILEK